MNVGADAHIGPMIKRVKTWMGRCAQSTPTDSYEGFLNWKVFFALIRLALAWDARATFPIGEGFGDGLPRQSALYHGMTATGSHGYFRFAARSTTGSQ